MPLKETEDQLKRIDVSKYPVWFIKKIEDLLRACNARGAKYVAVSGYRDPKEQDALYAIGRTIDKDKPTVTDAPGYTSFHNYCLAIDFCRDSDVIKPGLQPSWDKKDYLVLAEEAERIGLLSGMSFRKVDAPHIQVPFIAGATGELKKILLSQGMTAVHDYCLNNLKYSAIFGRHY